MNTQPTETPEIVYCDLFLSLKGSTYRKLTAIGQKASRFEPFIDLLVRARPRRYNSFEVWTRSSRHRVLRGAIAQLGERLNGIQEVRGSTPLGSTKRMHFIIRFGAII